MAKSIGEGANESALFWVVRAGHGLAYAPEGNRPWSGHHLDA